MKKSLILMLLFVSLVTMAQEAEPDIRPANVYFKNGKLTVESDDKDFKLWFDNRVYVDGAYYMPSTDISKIEADENGDLMDNQDFYSGVEDDGVFKMSSGVIIRRARFGVKASLYEKWFAELDLDFAYNEVELKDMFIGYKFNDNFSIKAGNFKEPMSMERLTSSKYLMGMERPMAVQSLAGGRKLGIAATGWGKGWWASAGVFGAEMSAIQKERNRGSDGYGVTGRVAISPINNENQVLHIGGYAGWRTPEAYGMTDRWVYLKTIPESYVDRRRFVRYKLGKDGDGGYVNHYTTIGGELAYRRSKFLIYGEYIVRTISRYTYAGDVKKDLNNVVVGGWYATASYMLRGEQRFYSPDDAEFGPTNVKENGGNLEIAARVSTIDFNDFSEPLYIVDGGSAISYTASLNWYPNRNVAISLGYMYMDNDQYADDKGDLTVGGLPFSEALPDGLDFGVLQMKLVASF